MAFNRDNDRNLDLVTGIFSSQQDLNLLFSELERLGISHNDISVLMSEQTRGVYGDTWDEYGATSGSLGRNESYGSLDNVEGADTGTTSFRQATKMPEGAATGGLTGGVVGAIIGGLTLVGSVLLPGVGLLVAGPLVGAIAGGALGTAAGGLVGALAGLGIPENEAKFYQDSIQHSGNVLVVAHIPKSLKDEVLNTFKRCGAQSVKVGG
jgi:uncharacterized membrane protein